ncbi:hypothetical protein Bbelb_037510 [Branchiostoma belcheri]|nr:hypothetical protein Bbelb_037510 [Branchiostoma belcheri]
MEEDEGGMREGVMGGVREKDEGGGEGEVKEGMSGEGEATIYENGCLISMRLVLSRAAGTFHDIKIVRRPPRNVDHAASRVTSSADKKVPGCTRLKFSVKMLLDTPSLAKYFN